MFETYMCAEFSGKFLWAHLKSEYDIILWCHNYLCSQSGSRKHRKHIDVGGILCSACFLHNFWESEDVIIRILWRNHVILFQKIFSYTTLKCVWMGIFKSNLKLPSCISPPLTVSRLQPSVKTPNTLSPSVTPAFSKELLHPLLSFHNNTHTLIVAE